METTRSPWPFWYWIIVYVVVAAVVFGIVYLIATMQTGQETVSINTIQNQAQNIFGGNSTAPINSAKVDISATGFSPATVTIKKGQTVVWTNTDTAKHTVMADDKNGPHSPELTRGSSYTDTFATTGTFPYHCSLHPTMRGTITVTE